MRTDPTTVREMLDKIDDFLSHHDYHSRNLWSVLTALRGPDNSTYKPKEYVTVPIRAAAFPKTANAQKANADADLPTVFIGASFIPFHGYDMEQAERGGTHFNSHAKRAAKVLGLTTEED